MCSPERLALRGSSQLPIYLSHGRVRVCVRGALVLAVSLHTREAQREAPRILRARLNFIERNFRDDLGTNEHNVTIAADLELEKLLRLPPEHLVGQSFERLAEHDEAAALGVARAEMQIAQRSLTPAAAPLRREDHEVERA